MEGSIFFTGEMKKTVDITASSGQHLAPIHDLPRSTTELHQIYFDDEYLKIRLHTIIFFSREIIVLSAYSSLGAKKGYRIVHINDLSQFEHQREV